MGRTYRKRNTKSGREERAEGSGREQKGAEGSRRGQKGAEGGRREREGEEGRRREQKGAEESRRALEQLVSSELFNFGYEWEWND